MKKKMKKRAAGNQEEKENKMIASDFFREDIKFFFDEFAEPHKVDGEILDIIIDNEELKENQKKEYDGIYIADMLYFAKTAEYIEKLGELPRPEDTQRFDKDVYEVVEAREDDGIIEITLRRKSA